MLTDDINEALTVKVYEWDTEGHTLTDELTRRSINLSTYKIVEVGIMEVKNGQGSGRSMCCICDCDYNGVTGYDLGVVL